MLASASPANALSGNDLLKRLTNPAASPLPEGARVVQRSSHDGEGGNRDWGVWSTSAGRPLTFVRREKGGVVLLDERRPGCLARMWFTDNPVAVADISTIGRIQLFFDGERRPRVDVPAAEFFAGAVREFPRPLVGNANSSSGGHYSYIPFCFARSLKLRIAAIPDDQFLWYQLTELVLPHGSAVRRYEPGRLRTGEAARALKAVGGPPAGDPVATERLLGAGDTLPLVRRSGAGSIRFLRFTVTPFTPETLARLELRVRAGSAASPQIDVPLGALLGDGLSVRSIRSLAFGMDPAAGSGYFALPVPYRRGVSVEVRARTTARVRAEAWLGPRPRRARTLYGRRTVERSRLGLDFTALAANGSGRLAAWVLDLIGPPGSDRGPLQYFLEGDERVYVDGSRSPTVYGTGTEDAFNSGFYYSRGALSLPTHGAGSFISRGDGRGARSQYRVFGGDGYLWEHGIRFGMEHGGGDEHADEITASTAFWYGGPRRLRRTDVLRPSQRRSRRRHRLRGRFARTRLSAYFEGEHDGNTFETASDAFGGTAYPAPPPERSPEGVTRAGLAFRRPVTFELRLAPSNCGVVLRRLLDAGSPTSVAVSVDGRRVGPWYVAEGNPAKRWLSDDFALPSSETAGKRRIRVRLTPVRRRVATMFRLEALSRTGARCKPRRG
jgi:hypothetical protein